MISIFKKTPTTRTLFFLLTDILSVSAAVWIAFLLRFDGVIPSIYYPFIPRMIALLIIFIVPIFYFKKLYTFSWSYVSANELISLFLGSVTAFIFLAVVIFISKYFPYFINFPRSVFFSSFFLVFIFCGSVRFAKRIYIHFFGFSRGSKKERTIIVGAGDSAEQISRGILSSMSGSYHLVGFLDDNPIKRNIKIHGFPVLGKISDMGMIVEKYGIEQLIISLPSAGRKAIRNAVNLGREAGIKKIKITPAINEIINSEVSFRDLKDVDAGDLLNRDEIILDTRQINEFISGKIVLIPGAAGSIGSELCRQAARFSPKTLIMLDQDETGIFNISQELIKKYPEQKFESIVADVCDKEKISGIFRTFHPDIIFHAAAYKHVPLMENNSDEAVKNNIFGTENLVEASIKNETDKFVFISTDKAVNSTSVMGLTKRVSEMVCQAYSKNGKTRFVSVRFGNVLDSRGSVIPIFREQIKQRGPVEVTHPDMKRYFMLISEACLLVMQAGAIGQGGEVFVLDMGKPVKILDLARDMIKASGLEPDKDIAIVFTGTRPGEKLFEEILTAEEGTTATKYQRIFTAKQKEINRDIFSSQLNNLRNMDKGDKNELVGVMRRIIENKE